MSKTWFYTPYLDFSFLRGPSATTHSLQTLEISAHRGIRVESRLVTPSKSSADTQYINKLSSTKHFKRTKYKKPRLPASLLFTAEVSIPITGRRDAGAVVEYNMKPDI